MEHAKLLEAISLADLRVQERRALKLLPPDRLVALASFLRENLHLPTVQQVVLAGEQGLPVSSLHVRALRAVLGLPAVVVSHRGPRQAQADHRAIVAPASIMDQPPARLRAQLDELGVEERNKALAGFRAGRETVPTR